MNSAGNFTFVNISFRYNVLIFNTVSQTILCIETLNKLFVLNLILSDLPTLYL